MISRREFGGIAFLLSTGGRKLWGATGLDEIIRSSMQRRKIPAVTAVVATADKTIYTGAFGKRDAASGMDVAPDSIFAIASMTKAITSTAALQLVERGKLSLHEPAAKHLPELAKLEVLEGFDAAGKPILRPAKKPITLAQLLTHTSGFAYDTWLDTMFQYSSKISSAGFRGPLKPTPLAFEPGTRWQYGYGTDWTGRLVEAASGQTLEQYFQSNILGPLGMKDTSFILPAEKFNRLVSSYQKSKDGQWKEDPRTPPTPPTAFSGGGGLYSTSPDYVRFTQMILNKGRGAGKDQILQAKTVDMMTSNQIGGLRAGILKTARPELSADVDFHPGFTDKFGFGFLINTTAYQGGRSAGSLAWAGIRNTFYWIDPKRGVCAVVMMHFLPFVDPEAIGLLGDFEHGVYAQLSRGV